MTKKPEPTHPGKILYEQAMQPLGVSRNKLARDIDVPVGRISDIVAGKRGITPDTALRLGKYFGTSAEMWMQFQSDFDLFVARNSEWQDIAPRVREMQPIDPNAVVPVTALDGYAEHWDDSEDDYPVEDSSEIDDDERETTSAGDPPPPPDALSVDDLADEPEAESNEKWWSTSLSDPAEAALDETARSSQAEGAEVAEEPLDQADSIDLPAETSMSDRTITLDVKPKDRSADPIDTEASEVSNPDSQPAVAQKTFAIDIHPASAESHVVAEHGQESSDIGSTPQFRVDVVREAAQALRTTPDSIPHSETSEIAPAASGPLGEEDFTIEFDEDELAAELPGDAFADHDEEESVAREAVTQQSHDAYAPAIARTGTDDFEPIDPPFAGPGLDLPPSASSSPGPSLGRRSGIGDLTPAGWSSALDAARREERNPEAAPQSEVVSTATASDADEHVDVPLPSDFEPSLEGPLPPWTPPAADDPQASLDIPDPEEAPKLYEYDD
jgi:addiction module HigA family antidote